MITLVVRQGIVGERDCRGNLPKSSIEDVFDEVELEALEEALSHVISEENVIEPIRFTILGLDGESFPVDIYVQRGRSSPLLRVRFKSKKGAANSFDSRPYIRSHFNVGDRLYLRKEDGHVLRIIRREPAGTWTATVAA